MFDVGVHDIAYTEEDLQEKERGKWFTTDTCSMEESRYLLLASKQA